jgi:hypothetical protein
MSANASLTIVGGPQRIEPGRETVLTAQIVNLGTEPDDFRLSVREIDPAWVTFRPPVVYLRPGERANAAITIVPPTGIPAMALRPIFRLLSRRAGNVAIVEIALPVPAPAAAPATARAARTPATPQVPVPPPGSRTGGRGLLPLILGVGTGLLLVAMVVGIGGFVLARREPAAPPTTTAVVGGEPVEGTASPTAPPSAPPQSARPAGAPSSAPAVAARTFVVANTGGDGVYLRRTPNLDDRDTAYVDDTPLVQIGPDVQAGGLTWRHVRAPDGKTGYVPAQYTEERR